MRPFSGKPSWKEEYDRRLKDPTVPKDTMKSWRLGGSETRVADDAGILRRRNGAVCCGCGRAGAGDAHHTEATIDSTHSHHGDDEPKLFLGLF